MSLDKRIKEIAEGRVDALVDQASRILAKAVGDSPMSVPDVARLISEHKTKTTRDRCVKAVADQISKEMLSSMANSGSEDES